LKPFFSLRNMPLPEVQSQWQADVRLVSSGRCAPSYHPNSQTASILSPWLSIAAFRRKFITSGLSDDGIQRPDATVFADWPN
jgi:hypothetical protein